MKGYGLLWLASAQLATAYPSVLSLNPLDIEKRDGVSVQEQNLRECNTGIICSQDFDAAAQFVDVRKGSAHEFQPPGENDLRGECPGLNAAANHGFLPRNGIATILETVNGLRDAYGMSTDLSSFLAVAAVALSGDYATQTWSIGGAYNSIDGVLLSEPQGILGTHNKYEGDASVVRGDAYLNGGSVADLKMDSFDALYNSAQEFTLATLRAHNDRQAKYSVANNPHYFSAPFSGLVTPAAHEFIVNFMSNHSASRPSGYLNRNILKTFYSISGPDNAHVWKPGYERIPNNWYRRPLTNTYSIPKNLADTSITALVYPGTVRIGGNTGKVNSFTGVDISDLTGGTYNAKNLFQGNNLGCFFIQAFQAGLPDQLKGFVSDIAPILALVKSYTGPLEKSLGCKPLAKYNQGLFNQFPGYNDTEKPPTGSARRFRAS